MMTPTTKPRISSAFGAILEQALLDRGMSVRQLSRMWSERFGGKPESRRRALHKYIDDGVSPGDEHRAQLAELLELSVDVFALEADIRREKQEVADALVPLVDVLYRIAREASRGGRL